MTFQLNEAALRSVALAAARDDLRVRANRVLNAARRACPVDEGRLRASLAVEFVAAPSPTEVAVRIGSNLPYAIFVHEGTGLHGPNHAYITPKRGRVLVWPVKNNAYRSTGGSRRYKGGKTAKYAAATRVSGVRPRPFLRDALPAAR